MFRNSRSQLRALFKAVIQENPNQLQNISQYEGFKQISQINSKFPKFETFSTSTIEPVKKKGDNSQTPLLQFQQYEQPQVQDLTPQQLVHELDKYIIGQGDAKRQVATAIRNRWRRHRIKQQDMKEHITPKNILMIGPTGVGKTEIARTLAKITNAPFVKVEATKFTELGFYGKDVDSIIESLLDNAVQMTKQNHVKKYKQQINELVEKKIVEILTGQGQNPQSKEDFISLLRRGDIDGLKIEIDVNVDRSPQPINNQNFQLPIQIFRGVSPRVQKREMPIHEARQVLEEQESQKMIDDDLVQREAINLAQQDGIVFIDEIDKIVVDRSRSFQADASSEGVQKDLLPIIEGSTVQTSKYGQINTDHILFICSGAFTTCKPQDMLAELLGRLPIRVNLKALSLEDFQRILKEPQHNLLKQQELLMDTENVDVEFTQEGVEEIARIAQSINNNQENIGARRLHTIVEKVMDKLSFSAPVYSKEAQQQGDNRYKQVIDRDYIKEHAGDLMEDQQLSKYLI